MNAARGGVVGGSEGWAAVTAFAVSRFRDCYGFWVCGCATSGAKPGWRSGALVLFLLRDRDLVDGKRAPRRWRKPPPSPSCAFATGASSDALLNEAPN